MKTYLLFSSAIVVPGKGMILSQSNSMQLWRRLMIKLQMGALLLLSSGILYAQTVPIYTYSVPAGGYAANGNVVSYADSVNGTWGMTYDGLNRLTSAAATAGPYSGVTVGWGYDSFGNRTGQAYSGTSSATLPSSSTVSYDANNRISASSLSPSAPTYDSAGNLTADGANQVAYDAEGRVCAVYNSVRGGSITQYLYNADGQRVAKGSPVDNVLACPTDLSNFVVTERYILGQGGEQVTELDQSNHWKHTNVYSAAGEMVATYDTAGLHFPFTDGVGTKRVQVSGAGAVELTCTSLPFGDGPDCLGATEHFYTGKERDQESGLDYFGARYYGSNMGRWMSPDWAEKPEPVPYSSLDNPQSLNLYEYVGDNPLSGVDPDGHYFVVGGQDQKFYQQVLTDLYRRPGGRDLVNSLANSDRPVILDRRSLDTADTGTAGVTNALAISGQAGVAGAHVTVGTDTDLAAGAKMAPGQVSPDVTTGHELEHANDGITAGQNSLQAGAAAMAAGDAPSSPGAHNTVGGTAQSRAEDIMGQKTDMNKKDAGAAVQGILSSGQQQWQNSTNRSAICSQNQGACH